MNKTDYKLAYDYIYNLINLDDDSMKWPLTIDSMNIFKELVDEKINKPTLEEVKKEWEEEGYSFKIYNDEYHNGNVYKRCVIYKEIFMNKRLIVLHYWNKTITFNYFWETFDDEGYTVNKYMSFDITFQEHQLLTKTFRALGWYDYE